MADGQNNDFFLVDDTITAARLTLPTVTVDTQPIYPSEYWAAVGAERRPPVSHWNMTPQVAYHYFMAMLNQGSWEDVTVCTFMISVMAEHEEQFRATAPGDWISEGVTILGANQQGTPLNILHLVVPAGGAPPNPPENVMTPSDPQSRLRMFWCLVMLYRKALTAAMDPTYGAQIATRLNNFFKVGVYSVTQDNINTINPIVHQDKLTVGYLRLIASIDMFYFKFQNHKFSSCRIATLPSRYRGCSALTSLGYIAGKMGLDVRILALYILTRPVAVDLARIAKTGESLADIEGYFPYQCDMGLTTKSPYSLNANPTFYLWIHTIGSVLNLQRSLSAVFPQAAQDLSGTITSAAAVALHLTSTFTFNRQVALNEQDAAAIRERRHAIEARAQGGPDAQNPEDQGLDDLERDPLPPMPVEANENARQANAILENIIANDGLAQAEKLELHRKLAIARTYRANSIGRYLSGFWM
ncbi:MAG: nucleocapsid protein [Alxa tick rhabdovirus]|uniref:Nucleoprotein n=1 Tax=Alxa tick rhabdovirus TaxID=2977131 RepID=A0A977WLB1_9RHAB|nr:MAG: nucleocapsid protein [Alxa tick rhabdovirus]